MSRVAAWGWLAFIAANFCAQQDLFTPKTQRRSYGVESDVWSFGLVTRLTFSLRPLSNIRIGVNSSYFLAAQP
jgi:hypothetical protein